MNTSSPPVFPSSFDPALHLHSEAPEDASCNFSDDINALNDLLAETTARKNREGIVVQHRAWKTSDVFRSEDDHPIGTSIASYSTDMY